MLKWIGARIGNKKGGKERVWGEVGDETDTLGLLSLNKIHSNNICPI